MRRLLVLTLVTIVSGAFQHSADILAQGSGEWTTLFDGSSLNGWKPAGDANWQVVDGVIQANRGNGFLASSASYRDFDLTLEFWVDPDANSGVFIRCSDPQKIGADTCYEVNIFDKRPEQDYRSGAIVNVAKPMSVINTGGKWNTYAITAKGPRMTVTLNGTRTVDVEHSGHAQGPIALQYSVGTVKFRNVRIRPL
jgi:hypothetical protein